MILVDSSIWIDHLRARDGRLARFLEARQILSHPFVIGELALGYLPRRDVFLSELRDLTQAAVASDDEVLDLINRVPLFGRGIGYVDAHLLAAVRLTPDTTLWTAETRLRAVTAELGLAAMLPQ